MLKTMLSCYVPSTVHVTTFPEDTLDPDLWVPPNLGAHVLLLSHLRASAASSAALLTSSGFLSLVAVLLMRAHLCLLAKNAMS